MLTIEKSAKSRSVERVILTKSVIKTSHIIPNAEMTEFPREKKGERDKTRLENRSTDLVYNPNHDPLVNGASAFHQRKDARETLRGQHDTRGGFGHVRRRTDRNPHFRLFQGGCIVDPIACHTRNMPTQLDSGRRLEVQVIHISS
jgi:hypothetical protein